MPLVSDQNRLNIDGVDVEIVGLYPALIPGNRRINPIIWNENIHNNDSFYIVLNDGKFHVAHGRKYINYGTGNRQGNSVMCFSSPGDVNFDSFQIPIEQVAGAIKGVLA